MTRGDDRWIRDEALRRGGQSGPIGPDWPDADPPTVPGASGRRARHASPSAEPDGSGPGTGPYSWTSAYGEPASRPGNGHYRGGHGAAAGRYGAPDPYLQPGARDTYRQPGLGDPLSQPGARPDRDPYSQPGVPDPVGQPGARDSYGQPGMRDPVGQSARPDRDLYRQPAVTDPFGQPDRDLFRQPGVRDYSQPGVQPGRDPYSQPGVADPYSQPGVRPDRDPYSQPGFADPYSQPGVRPDRDPYSQPGVADPYSQPGVRDYSQPGVRPDRDPYSQPGVADPYSQPGVRDFSQPGVRPDRDPYSQPGVADPYSQPGVRDFSQPGVRPDRDPYSQPGVRDFSQPGVRPDRDPYSQPGVADPYSQPGVRDFSQPGVRPDRDPYSQPGIAEPYSQPGSAVAQNGRARRSFPDAPDGYGQVGDLGAPEGYGTPGGVAGPAARGRARERTQPAGSPPARDSGPPDGRGLPASYARPGDYGPPDGRGQPGGYGGPGNYGDQGAGQRGAASGPFRWQPAAAAAGPKSGPELPGEAAAAGRYPAEPGQPPAMPGGRRPGGDMGAPAAYQGASDAGRDSGQFGRDGWAERTGTGDQAAADDGGFIPGFDDSRDGGDGGPRRPRRTGRLLAPALAIVLAVALLCALVGGGYYLWGKLHSPDYSGAGTGSVTVQVMPGDTATSVAPRLVKLGVVASTNAFISAAKKSSNPAGLEPGTFRLHKHMSGVLAYALLLNPKSRLQTVVTIPDGLRLSQILSTLGKRTQWPVSAYTRAIKDTAALGLPAYAHGKAEGYLYPATYTIQPGTSALDILRAMVTRYNQEATSLNLRSVAAAKLLAPDQAIVVASLLEAEGGSPANYAKIARVIYNRLKVNMVLELDSTVLYALNKFGFKLTQAQLQVKSPYNTFIHRGLPPGPIDSPGQAAIEAALHPASGNWLYFVTVNPKTGLTKFTNSSAVFKRYEAQCQAAGAC